MLSHKTKGFYKLLSSVATLLNQREGFFVKAKGMFVHGDTNERTSRHCSRFYSSALKSNLFFELWGESRQHNENKQACQEVTGSLRSMLKRLSGICADANTVLVCRHHSESCRAKHFLLLLSSFPNTLSTQDYSHAKLILPHHELEVCTGGRHRTPAQVHRWKAKQK